MCSTIFPLLTHQTAILFDLHVKVLEEIFQLELRCFSSSFLVAQLTCAPSGLFSGGCSLLQ